MSPLNKQFLPYLGCCALCGTTAMLIFWVPLMIFTFERFMNNDPKLIVPLFIGSWTIGGFIGWFTTNLDSIQLLNFKTCFFTTIIVAICIMVEAGLDSEWYVLCGVFMLSIFCFGFIALISTPILNLYSKFIFRSKPQNAGNGRD